MGLSEASGGWKRTAGRCVVLHRKGLTCSLQSEWGAGTIFFASFLFFGGRGTILSTESRLTTEAERVKPMSGRSVLKYRLQVVFESTRSYDY